MTKHYSGLEGDSDMLLIRTKISSEKHAHKQMWHHWHHLASLASPSDAAWQFCQQNLHLTPGFLQTFVQLCVALSHVYWDACTVVCMWHFIWANWTIWAWFQSIASAWLWTSFESLKLITLVEIHHPQALSLCTDPTSWFCYWFGSSDFEGLPTQGKYWPIWSH